MPPKRKPKSVNVQEAPNQVSNSSDIDIDLIDKLANKGASVKVDDDFVPKLTSPLEEKQEWTAKQIVLLGNRYEKFRKNVFELCKDDEYRIWLQTTNQKEIAEKWGVSQSYISKTFGSIQRDLKEEVNKNIVALLEKGESIRSVENITGVSRSKIQRIASSQDEVSQNIPKNKMGHQEEYRAKKRLQYEKKDKEELIDLLIQRDEIIGHLKKMIKNQ